MSENETVSCIVDGKAYHVDEGLYLADLSTAIRQRVKRDYPKAKVTDFICGHHLLKYRLVNADAMINSDLKQSQKINRKLTRAMQSGNIYEITDVNETLTNSLTVGERVADNVARFGGSWGFIGIFVFVLIAWMLVNGLQLLASILTTFPSFC